MEDVIVSGAIALIAIAIFSGITEPRQPKPEKLKFRTPLPIRSILTWNDLEKRPDEVIEAILELADPDRHYFFRINEPYKGNDYDEITVELKDMGESKSSLPIEKDWEAKVRDKNNRGGWSVSYFMGRGQGTPLVVPFSGKEHTLVSFLFDENIPDSEKNDLFKTLLKILREQYKEDEDKNERYVCTDGREVDWVHIRLQKEPSTIFS